MFQNIFPRGIIKFIYAFLLISVVSVSFIGAAKYMEKDSSKTHEDVCFTENYAVKGDWIYYVSLYDNFIYKVKKDGSLRKLVCDNKAAETGIILSGNWIYYINVTDGYSLYRVNTDGDGNGRIGISEITIENTDFFMWSDSIYYTDYLNIIHRIDNTGKDESVKNNAEVNSIARINRFGEISDGSIFFTDDSGIYKMKINSQAAEKLSDDVVYSGIKVLGTYLYYVNNEDYMLYRISLNGKIKEKLSGNAVVMIGADYDSGGFYIYENQVYFTSLQSNGKCELLSFNVNSRECKKILSDIIHFNVCEGRIYYMDGTDDGNMYQANLNGRNGIKLFSGSLMPYMDVKDDLIFFGVKSTELDQSVWGRFFVLSNGREFELK